MTTAGEGASATIGIPVCYLRSETGYIFDLQRPHVPLWQRRPAQVGATLIVTVIAVAAFVMLRPRSPPAMTGAFNIAVAEFGALSETGEPRSSIEATSLAASVARVLDDELVAGFADLDIEVRPPDEVGTVDGRTRDQRADKAAALADQIRADIVVYGTLSPGGSMQSFQPEFYLSDRTLRDAEELVGQYELGQPSAVDPNNPVSVSQLRANLLTRTEALTQFVIGLGYYALGDYEVAQEQLLLADRIPGWSDDEGKEILYILLGNTAGELGGYDEALAYYEKALAIEPGYARARIGVAEAVFTEASDTTGVEGDRCQPEAVDAAGLEMAISRFEDALEAAYRPARAVIPEKVAFGIGRVYLCQLIAGITPLGDPADQFEIVIAAYESGNERLREQAAEAHANVALIHLVGAENEADYHHAVDEYAIARQLTNHPDRRAVFAGMQGFALVQLGECDMAQSEYASAIAMTTDDDDRARLDAEMEDVMAKCGG